MKKMKLIVFILIMTVLAACGAAETPDSTDALPPSIQVETVSESLTETEVPQTVTEDITQPTTQAEPTPIPEVISIAVQNLQTPWEIVFLPDGRMLITERPGTLTLIDNEKVQIPIMDVFERSESGLLGLALHPDFEENQWLYLYLTYEASDGLLNRVERYQFDGITLTDKLIIIDQIPGSNNHDGGRIEFGPDGLLYITTGDAGNSSSAQDINSLAGKILRLHDDGSIPQDNPFGSAVFSYGHRNPQGLAWDDQGGSGLPSMDRAGWAAVMMN